jgi:sulfoacetaldehyde dehydrogenase
MAIATEEKQKGITPEQQQELDAAFERARQALAIIETYDQARVDRLCQAVAWAVANKRTFARLVEMGIQESGLGDAVSRMGKRMKIRGVLRDALRARGASASSRRFRTRASSSTASPPASSPASCRRPTPT